MWVHTWFRKWRSWEMMIIVLLRFGFATPTEVSVIAVFYALLAGVFIVAFSR